MLFEGFFSQKYSEILRRNVFLAFTSLFSFFSRGVNRVMAILLTLASLSLKHTQYGVFPILLLDDTFAELDLEMKQRLMRFIMLKTQFFYATVLPDDVAVLETVKLFEVDSGVVTEGQL